ncbi:Swi5 [Novymonas esmeraldas]|uniref:Swi5 n=1 Tax=Novymonas esmeraldas TaxID=1808958 RepID=A0AAW0EQ04_9TRYP
MAGAGETVTPYQLLSAELAALPYAELLHRYNGARDLAHELMGLLAQHRQCTIAQVHQLLEVRSEATRCGGCEGP